MSYKGGLIITVSQFLNDLQNLIKRGTISPSAEIEVRGEATSSTDDEDYDDEVLVDFFSDNLEIEIHESCYNKLVVIMKTD